ncbi:MAG: hypothetical protein ACP5OA_05350 [Candidatus Woesearchaeota archaeon]
MKSKTLYEKFGDKLLEEEDKAGPSSYKRLAIYGFNKDYLYRKSFFYILLLIALGICLLVWIENIYTLSDMESKMLKLGIVLFIGVITFVLAKKFQNENSSSMDENARRRFDADYGKGAYDKTMNQIREQRK